MEENYYQLHKNIINNLKEKKRLLLHSCCAPCSSYVITYLTNYFDITILYYNPNIYPKEEYIKRKEEQIKLINNLKTKNKLDYLDCEYDNQLYQEKIKGHENDLERGPRCTICFDIRLERTAQLAKNLNYDYFCSTLTVSPYKNAKLINQIGLEKENKYNISWLYSDFKKENGYKESIILSKKYNLYRQDYCGCIYSKNERLAKKESNNIIKE